MSYTARLVYFNHYVTLYVIPEESLIVMQSMYSSQIKGVYEHVDGINYLKSTVSL